MEVDCCSCSGQYHQGRPYKATRKANTGGEVFLSTLMTGWTPVEKVTTGKESVAGSDEASTTGTENRLIITKVCVDASEKKSSGTRGAEERV